LASVVIANLGPGYAVVSQGPLNADQFASSSPDPSAAASALDSLSHSITTYQRVWQDASADNQVQDLVVRFSSTASARAFLSAAQHSLASGKVVSTAALPTIAGAMRTTYFASTTQVGVGQAITMRSGPYVVLLSIFSSSASTNTQPITADDAVTIAQSQHAAVAKAATTPAKAQAHARPKTVGRGGWNFVVAAALFGVFYLIWQRRTRRRASPPA
jgi:hypothetical protein